jgi:hypothetical protein
MTQDEISQEESNSVRKEVDKLRLLVKLQLNPKSATDIEIMNLIDEMPEFTDKHYEKEMKDLLGKIVTKSQFLLKDEWDTVRDESLHGDLRERRKFFRI